MVNWKNIYNLLDYYELADINLPVPLQYKAESTANTQGRGETSATKL
jgi:hypothetical protein